VTVRAQVDSVAREVEVREVRAGGGSASLPPSPNTRPSPLHEHTRTLPHAGTYLPFLFITYLLL
jgi:hypothetical protein